MTSRMTLLLGASLLVGTALPVRARETVEVDVDLNGVFGWNVLGKAEAVVAEMVDRVHDGANASECDVDVTVERLWTAYRLRPSTPAVAVAEAALRARGYEPRQIATGGGSDANAFNAAGFSCVNLANGTERNHEPGERVSVAALEGMLDVTFALVEEAAVAC